MADLQLFLDRLPCTPKYELSYLHRDVVCAVAVSQIHSVVMSLSVDGIVKFWKKTENNIEILRYYKAHSSAPIGLHMSKDESFAASWTCNTVNVYNVKDCDLINIICTALSISSCCLFKSKGIGLEKIACSIEGKPEIAIFQPFSNSPQPEQTIDRIHKRAVATVAYCDELDCLISSDVAGVLEYFHPWEPFALPKSLSFKLKSETDLFSLAVAKCRASSLVISPNSRCFAIASSDDKIRIFETTNGRLLRTIASSQCRGNLVFDSTGSFVIYASESGIKIASIGEEAFDRIVASDEAVKFSQIALYQGQPKGRLVTLEQAASSNPAFERFSEVETCIFATGTGKNRLYLVSRRLPQSQRDIENEKFLARSQPASSGLSEDFSGCSVAVIHTDCGDIRIKLLREDAPKAVFNFCSLARKNYYNRNIFHRVIKDFMIQTGDPTGNGAGGESIWGSPFEDEFSTSVSLDQPFCVCMANSGPNSNGSQFFITVVKTPWLQHKHTVFARVIDGFNTVLHISNTKTSRLEKPVVPISIQDIELRKPDS